MCSIRLRLIPNWQAGRHWSLSPHLIHTTRSLRDWCWFSICYSHPSLSPPHNILYFYILALSLQTLPIVRKLLDAASWKIHPDFE